MRNPPTLILALALGACTCLAGAQEANRRGGPGAPGDDASFVQQASAAGLAEVQLGQLAATQAQSSAVKQFGELMVKDHDAANQELAAIAKGKGYTVAKAPMPADQAATQQLQAAEGAAFDPAFVRKMVSDHRKAAALFQQEAQQGKDPQVQAFARKTLPVIEHHLAMAKALNKGGNAPVAE